MDWVIASAVKPLGTLMISMLEVSTVLVASPRTLTVTVASWMPLSLDSSAVSSMGKVNFCWSLTTVERSMVSSTIDLPSRLAMSSSSPETWMVWGSIVT